MDKNRKTYYLYIQRKPGEKYERSIENFDKNYLGKRGTEWFRLKLIDSWYVTDNAKGLAS
jgi:hypothetical protein